MSGQWEVVGKKKDKAGKLNLPKSVKENKKPIQNGPRVEDVLPMSQVKTLFAASGKGNKENLKPQEKAKAAENVQKKVQQKKSDKPQEPSKPKPPKSIESALNSIDVEEFTRVYENTKLLFPDGPIVWLKEMAQFLNLKVPVEVSDPLFSNKNDQYPLIVVPGSIKSIIAQAVTSAGITNAQLFFDISLTAMATDMSKGLSALGHKIFLQYLALVEPKIAIASLNKHAVLRNSYQNRQTIGLSILWALGQTALTDFNIGLKVFQEIMLPLLEMKNYSRYIMKYLLNLINNHHKVNLTKDQYLSILDIVFSSRKSFPTDLQQDFYSILPKLKQLLYMSNTSDKLHTFIEPFLKKINGVTNKKYQDELCEVAVFCLSKDKTSFSSWTKCYTKYLVGSTTLLHYLGDHWQTVKSNINKKVLSDVLNTYSVTNDELMTKKRKEEGLLGAIEAIKKLTEKMTTKKNSGFPFTSVFLLFLITCSGLIYYDIIRNGSWEKSTTFKSAKDLGVYEYTLKAVDRTKQGVSWLNNRIEENFPEYYKATADYLEPFGDLAVDMVKIGRNYFYALKETVVEKYPIVLQSIESYAPGLLEQSQQAVQSVWSTSILYFNRSVDYLRKEVFVGQLSPENMQKMVLEAFNTTQQKATEYYHWLYEKVQTTIK